ncbi:MAG: DUF4157 domain-containing protein [Dehalococcoidia bacterium]
MAERERINRTRADEGILKRPDSDTRESVHSKDRSQGESRGNHPGSISDIASLQSASPVQRARLLHNLQRTYGNAYVQRLLNSSGIQAKLTVSSPDDQYEQEADVVGEAIAEAVGNQTQRQEEEEELQMKVQRQMPEEEEEMLQGKAVDPRVPEVSDEIEGRIDSARGSGQVMPENVRDTVESQMGYDLSGVRLHTDSESSQISEQLNARAFTTGNDIFFRAGEYQPETGEGRKLLGHELTHVVQQGAATAARQAVETAAEESSTGQMEAGKALEEARKNAWIAPTRENMRGLLANAAICLGLGMEGDVQSALDSVTGKAVETVKNQTGLFDLPASSLNVANDIIDKLKEIQPSEQNNIESTAQMVGDGLGGWAVEQMSGTAEMLRQDPSDDVASHVVEKTALVLMLGRDYSPGVEAIQKWAIEKNRISEEAAEEE